MLMGLTCHSPSDWTGIFGDKLRLSTGDALTLTLHQDRSVSVSYNNTQVTDIFTNLPDRDLWVVIAQDVKKMTIVEPELPRD